MEENKQDNLTFAERLGNVLKSTQKEIEELALQFSLGKSEAADKFEEIKKEFNTKAAEWKQSYSKLKTENQDVIDKVKTKLDELQLQLSLGKAEGRDLFNEQKKKIINSLHELETEFKNNPDFKNRLIDFNEELEKFKLKLDILQLKFENKTFDLKEGFKKEMLNARIGIDRFISKDDEKLGKNDNKKSAVSEEISNVYEHLKKAIKSL